MVPTNPTCPRRLLQRLVPYGFVVAAGSRAPELPGLLCLRLQRGCGVRGLGAWWPGNGGAVKGREGVEGR